jgi:glycosyltransferase involved in cell wall biosynthesis
MKISIITVCRNRAATIGRTFESIIQQKYRPIQYVVVDGQSTDGTIEVIRDYAGKFANAGIPFEWKSEPDGGIYDAMNKGIVQSTGDVVGIINSDDYYEPDALTAVAGAAVENPQAGIFYGFLRVIMGNGQELQTYRYRYENYLNNRQSGVFSGTQHPTCFVRRKVYDQVGFFDTGFPIAADYDFLLRAHLADVDFMPLDRVLTNFSLGGASDTMSDYERFKQRYAIMFKNGLMSEEEYRKARKNVQYTWYKQIKTKFVSWLLNPKVRHQ